MAIQPVIAAAFLVATHLFAHHLRALEGVPRSRWLSGAGGASVAYVFLHLLPEIAAGHEEGLHALGLFGEQVAWVLALAGLTFFYALEALVRRKRRDRDPAMRDRDATATGAFWIHLGSFALYNVITGYLLTHGEDRTDLVLALFTVALALHFLVVDYGLREDTIATWRHVGRWVVSAALLAGLAVGLLTEPPRRAGLRPHRLPGRRDRAQRPQGGAARAAQQPHRALRRGGGRLRRAAAGELTYPAGVRSVRSPTRSIRLPDRAVSSRRRAKSTRRPATCFSTEFRRSDMSETQSPRRDCPS